MNEIETLSIAELLCLLSATNELLRKRGVLRSANNPTGDLGETLFCRSFGWIQARNSRRGYDATGPDGTTYEIKTRRLHSRNKSRQLSAIRNFRAAQFDVLAGLLLDENYRVFRAALIPRAVIGRRAKHVEHTNSLKFLLTDDVWDIPDVEDVTDELRRTEVTL